MSMRSRRSFLKSASATAAIMSVSRGQTWAQPSSSPVRVWSTYRDRRHVAGEPLAWKAADQISAEAVILNPQATRQEILGFGTAMTDSTCYVLSQLTQSDR